MTAAISKTMRPQFGFLFVSRRRQQLPGVLQNQIQNIALSQPTEIQGLRFKKKLIELASYGFWKANQNLQLQQRQQ